jgi:DNA ligase (NAD+)
VEGEVAWYCVNIACPAQIIRNMEHFVSRGAMDIVGLGMRIVEQLVEEGLVEDVADLYALRKEDLLGLEGFAEKKADNLVKAIQASRKSPLHRLINALGIHGVGEVAAEELSTHFTDLDALSTAQPEQIEAIEGFGPNTAEAIQAWFSIDRNIQVVEKLKRYGVWPVSVPQKKTGPAIFEGKRFVVTGTLPSFSRDEIKDFIKARGGKVSDTVSAKTDYLVAGENAGSKLEKAQALGVSILTEAELLSLSEKEV